MSTAPRGSTEEVASRARVGIGTVFRHFPTKAELIEAALVRHLDQPATQAENRTAADDAGAGLFAVITERIHAGATKLTLASLLSGDTITTPVHEAGTRVRAKVDALQVPPKPTLSLRFPSSSALPDRCV